MSDYVKWIGSSLLLVVCLSSSQCCADELFDEVKAGFFDVERRFKDCSLQASYRELAVIHFKEVQQTAISSIFKDKFYSVTRIDPETELEEVRVVNDKYAFAVTRAKGSKRYNLVKFSPRHSDDEKMQSTIDSTLTGVRSRLFNTYVISASWPVWDLIRDPGFRVLSAERVTQQGQSCIKIAYEAVPQRPINAVTSTQAFEGYFICNPALDWAITEQWLTSNDSDPNGSLRLYSPKQTDGGLQMSARFLSAFVPESDIDAARTRLGSAKATFPPLGFKLVEVMDAPTEEQFFLSHFGLIEPQLKGFVGPWVWYVLGAVVLAVAAGGFYRSRRK